MIICLFASPISRWGAVDAEVKIPTVEDPRAITKNLSKAWSRSISVFMSLSTAFHSINSPDNSPFSHSILPVLSLSTDPFNYISLYESLLQP